MYKKLTAYDNEVLCGCDDPHCVDKIVDWIYDVITKGRSYGAIKGEMHDKTYENPINELEEQIESLKKEGDGVTNERNLAVVELAKIKTAEPPMKEDYKAVG
jgi:hypothetical protein